jgi:hypothetical protein
MVRFFHTAFAAILQAFFDVPGVPIDRVLKRILAGNKP